MHRALPQTRFLRIAGVPLLDFINTWSQHATHIDDRLESPEVTALFFSDFFQSQVKINPSEFQNVLKLRKELRNLILHLSTSKTKVNTSKFWPFKKLMKAKISFSRDQITKTPLKNRRIQLNLENPIETILLNQTLQFLEYFEPLRLKKCHNQNCSHFFYDMTKSKSRSWCSMRSCGNLAKVRNFRKRRK